MKQPNEHRTKTQASSGDPIDTSTKLPAKKLGCTFRIGKYGITLWANGLPGMRHKLIKVTPLDGWITSPKEVERIIRERGLEL